MENEYKNIHEFIEGKNIDFTIFQVPARPDKLLQDLPRHFYYAIKFDGKYLVGFFSQGSAHKKIPKPSEILDSIISDARFGEYDFEKFCDEYGYDDEDSREAERVHRACREQLRVWEEVFGPLPDIEEEL